MRALCFHGIGSGTPSTFAAGAMARLRGRVPELQHRSVHWGPLLDVHQKAQLREMRRRGSRGNLVQGISYEVLGDALAYRNVEGAVRHVADYEASTLGGVDVVFAHSLGCVLALGWLASRPMANPVTLVTIGCNLGLWQAGSVTPFEKPRQVVHWVNAFDATDGLGGPIGGFVPYVRDVEVEVGRPWYAFLVPAADHIGYWGDKTLWSRTVPALLGR